ncbi:MAG TPA: GNAT family N-acetyltransferase, partial [Ktedonobacteraceae bacterium]|nr:GNAT family N-acetyltransferase [Ktedonobacteraceae bacterium]
GVCFIDYDRQMALVAYYHNPQTGQHEIIGVGRFIKEPGEDEAEFAVIVTDRFQRKGLGTELMRQLIQIARNENLQRLIGEILIENQGMQAVCKKLGYSVRYAPEEGLMRAQLAL